MAKTVSNLVMSAAEEFFFEVRDLAAMLGVSTADLVRDAVRARLDDPPPIDFENTSGPRVNGLRVHVDPELKAEIVAAAEAQGLSISRWLECAIATHVIVLLQKEAAKAEARRMIFHKAAVDFRASLHAVHAREGSPAQQAKRERSLTRLREMEELSHALERGLHT